MTTKDEVIAYLSKLPHGELQELIYELEEQWNIHAPVTLGGQWSKDDEKEPELFDVILQHYGQNKISVIKEIIAILKVGLKAAKDFVESTDQGQRQRIIIDVTKDEAELVAARLRNAGAIVKVTNAST